MKMTQMTKRQCKRSTLLQLWCLQWEPLITTQGVLWKENDVSVSGSPHTKIVFHSQTKFPPAHKIFSLFAIFDDYFYKNWEACKRLEFLVRADRGDAEFWLILERLGGLEVMQHVIVPCLQEFHDKPKQQYLCNLLRNFCFQKKEEMHFWCYWFV